MIFTNLQRFNLRKQVIVDYLEYQSPNKALQLLRASVRLLPRGRNPLLTYLDGFFSETSTYIIETHYGFDSIVNIKDQIGRDIFFHGVYEPVTTAVIEHLLRPGDIFVDVGANIGFFTLLAAERVSQKGRVYAFEPSSRIRKMLVQAIKINSYNNIEVDSRACTQRSGVFSLKANDISQLGGTKVTKITRINDENLINGVSVDEFVAEKEINRIDLLKMDIEGGEEEALKGMLQTLERGIIDKLIIEFHPLCGLETGWPGVKYLISMISGFGYSYKQIREHSPVLGEHYKCKFSNNLFYDVNYQGTSMREIATPQYLFQKNKH